MGYQLAINDGLQLTAAQNYVIKDGSHPLHASMHSTKAMVFMSIRWLHSLFADFVMKLSYNRSKKMRMISFARANRLVCGEELP